MHEAQSEIKLPSIDIHAAHRLPIRMNPNYRLKYTNPIRIQYLRFLDKRSLDDKLNEPFCLEKFAKINHYSYEKSYEYKKKERKPIKKINEQIEYRKPVMRYFNPEDSGVQQDEVEQILSSKSNKLISSKVFVSE